MNIEFLREKKKNFIQISLDIFTYKHTYKHEQKKYDKKV